MHRIAFARRTKERGTDGGRLAPDNVRRMQQWLHHVIADAPWSDEALLRQARNWVLPALQKQGPVVCWIVDDTGFPKKAVIRWG